MKNYEIIYDEIIYDEIIWKYIDVNYDINVFNNTIIDKLINI